MGKKSIKWKQVKEPPSFPKWLKSYHLLVFAFTVMLLFGLAMKQFCNV